MIALCIISLGIGLASLALYGSMRAELDFLYRQLEETERGSNRELTLQSRSRPLVRLCRRLNKILREKEEGRIRYEEGEKRLKQDMVSLAHDIRTPLTGAAGYLQLAQECDGKKRERYLAEAGKRLLGLSDMLEEMFLYTKLSGEEFSLTMQRLRVLPILEESVLGFYVQFEERGLAPLVEFEKEDMEILADEEALRRIFCNLLGNALLHGAGDIQIRQRGESLLFENALGEDAGIEPERIFDRFYKGDQARGKGSSGLGLFIVKELMERMGGSAAAEVRETADGRRLLIRLEWGGEASRRN